MNSFVSMEKFSHEITSIIRDLEHAILFIQEYAPMCSYNCHLCGGHGRSQELEAVTLNFIRNIVKDYKSGELDTIVKENEDYLQRTSMSVYRFHYNI